MNIYLRARQPEAQDVMTFIFQPEVPVIRTAGQTMRFEIQTELGWEERWFTVSTAPYEKHIAITTRLSNSRFKQALAALKPGDVLRAHGPSGTFGWQPGQPERSLLIAGGLGVTPFRSMLLQRHSDGAPLDATLLYFNSDSNVPFRSALEDLAATDSSFSPRFIIGKPVSLTQIEALGEGLHGKRVYLSGPEPMVEQVGAALIKAGLPAELLVQDWFSGYHQSLA